MYVHQGSFICYFHYTHTCEALEPERGRGSQQDSIIIMNESINQSFRYLNFINKCFDPERNDLKEKQRILKLFSNFYNVSLLYPTQDGLRFLKIGEKSWFAFFCPSSCPIPALSVCFRRLWCQYIIQHTCILKTWMYFISLYTCKECIQNQCFYCYSHVSQCFHAYVKFYRYSFYQLAIFNFE